MAIVSRKIFARAVRTHLASARFYDSLSHNLNSSVVISAVGQPPSQKNVSNRSTAGTLWQVDSTAIRWGSVGEESNNDGDGMKVGWHELDPTKIFDAVIHSNIYIYIYIYADI